MTVLTLRRVKGSDLEWDEVDDNFQGLSDGIDAEAAARATAVSAEASTRAVAISGLSGTYLGAGAAAVSAHVLTTPRAINGTNFDGSAPITIAAGAGTLTGTALAASVVTSSLTGAAGGSFGSAAFVSASAFDAVGTAAAAIAGLASVAATGAYADLSGKPTLGTAAAHAAGDFDPMGAAAAVAATLAPVATSGVYADLTAKPTLATIATSGSASDLATGTIPAARLPSPSATTLGGVESIAAVAHQFLTSISTSGVPAQAQPAFTDVSGSLAAGQMPALTGDITTNAGAVATTLATVNGNVGTFGSATKASSVTVNAKGLVTAASEATVTPAVGSITGLGTGIATALGVNVGTAGAPVVNGGALGTPSAGVATNLTGTAGGLTAGNVTMNANLTGPITSSGNATSIASQTGTGTKFVVDTTPTLVTPVLGVATATSINGFPIANAAADGTTFGIPAFTAADFNASAGVISLDYTNAQAADGTHKGFLTAADWTTFNGKGAGTVTSIATTGPITGGTITGSGTIALNVGVDHAFTTGQSITLSSGATALTLSNGRLLLSGDITRTAWTTSGVRLAANAATYTDTTGNGTVATAYVDVFNAPTIAASNAVTYSNFYSHFIKDPVASTNVTFTNKWSLGLEGNLKAAGVVANTFNGVAITGSGTLALGAKTLTVSNTLTLAGTDSTTMTFPSTSATIARTDAGQTFTGGNTFSSAVTFSALTAGRIPFSGTAGLQTDSANLAWDNSNTRLNIGSPTSTSNRDIYLQKTVNGDLAIVAENLSSGTAGQSYFVALNSSGNGAYFGKHSTGYTTNGLLVADQGFTYNSSGNMAYYNIAATPHIFVSGGTAAANEIVRFDPTTGVTIKSGVKLQLGNAYVAGAQVMTGVVTLYDNTGTAYDVLCKLH